MVWFPDWTISTVPVVRKFLPSNIRWNLSVQFKFKQTNTSSKFDLPYSKLYLPMPLLACVDALIYRSFFSFTGNEAFLLIVVVLGISTALSCIMLQAWYYWFFFLPSLTESANLFGFRQTVHEFSFLVISNHPICFEQASRWRANTSKTAFRRYESWCTSWWLHSRSQPFWSTSCQYCSSELTITRRLAIREHKRQAETKTLVEVQIQEKVECFWTIKDSQAHKKTSCTEQNFLCSFKKRFTNPS